MRLFTLFILFLGSNVSLARADSGVLPINWAELNQQQAQISARRSPYPAALTTGVSKTTLPVYLPASHAYDNNMSIVADNTFYTITLFLNGATLVVSGDKSYQQSMGQDTQAQALQQATKTQRFTRAEGMMTTDFNRYGANYSLMLECDKPDEDQRCLQDDFLKQHYQELILVGGHP